MNWEQLLSPHRLGVDRLDHWQVQRSPFQRDYDRLVFSAAFRRLQDKTQVFPLAESDYVRTRLTHSLEAACVGRSIGTRVGAELPNLPDQMHASDVGAIVAAACLAHDIGNPPFGHSGEDAIQYWFASSAKARVYHELLTPRQFLDFERFEGNAQGFRVLTRLQMPDNRGGLQLTCATLGAFAKYPRLASSDRGGRHGASVKKFSFFQSEREGFEEVAERTGMIPRGDGSWSRHPLAFLVEAADDICYRIIDFEDGVQMGMLSYDQVSKAFLRVIDDAKVEAQLGTIRGEKERIEMLRARAIGAAVEEVARVFRENHEGLLTGEFDTPLIDCTRMAGELEEIRRISSETIYVGSRGVEIEAAGFEVISGLLDLYVEAVEEKAARPEKPSMRTRTVLRLIPEQFIGPDRIPSPDPYTRLQRVTDFVAGMTDSYAVSLYKKLRGISLPGQ